MGAWDFHQITARVLRSVDGGDGRISAPIEHIAALVMSPLWPLSAATLTEVDIESPREYKEGFHAAQPGVSLPDVLEGDILEIDGLGYPIAHVSEWPDRTVPTLRIIAQEVKF